MVSSCRENRLAPVGVLRAPKVTEKHFMGKVEWQPGV
jgi:hypothetical protein